MAAPPGAHIGIGGVVDALAVASFGFGQFIMPARLKYIIYKVSLE